MKVYISKQAAEKCLTYTRKFLDRTYRFDPTARDALLDARTEASRSALATTTDIDESIRNDAESAIRDIAWLVARWSKTNTEFWQMLNLLGIYAKEDTK